ncbi:uncharacterized protein LOC119614642 [Lucilia sericata]|uniref:uncharacterized protein LOC119614642 n=1 Tax=Lucilia sericata TaxID=13632 RepID=UPI0018A839B0|nr:uncharacterized protein LOC119614642 [Lucilia sericata]
MKLLYTVIIWGILQLMLIKPSPATSSTNTNALKEQLLDFYRKELKSISRNFLTEANNLCKQLLKDKRVQQASTPVMKEFKKNITDFLHDYPMYKHFDLVNELALLFDEKIHETYSNNNDLQYIWELLQEQGYDIINMNYESKYEKFIKLKFIPKFKEVKDQLSPQELKQHDELLNWFKELKMCTDFDCMSEHFNTFILKDQTPKEELQEYVQDQLGFLNMFYCYTAFELLQSVLKDPKLLQISTPLKHRLTIDINEFLMKFEITEDINDLQKEHEIFNSTILQKYYFNMDISKPDHNLIVEIFNAHGYAKLYLDYEIKFKDFIDRIVL